MSHKPLDSRYSLESCTLQLLSWRPFADTKTLDCDSPNPFYPHYNSTNGLHSTKRPCLSDRATSLPIDSISRLSLADDDNNNNGGAKPAVSRSSLRLVARKRRRRGSRSVSGRSSDRSGTRRCCSVGAHGTCSDFAFAVGTDSSGELFGDANWASDVSEARNSRRDRDGGGGSGDKEANVGGVAGLGFGFDLQGNESGYGSEPGYRGDAEFGYGDEFDEEEEDTMLLFWGSEFGGINSKMEVVREDRIFDQKSHHRCRRKKHEYKLFGSMR